MLRTATLALLIAVAGPAAAQSFGVGIYYGSPGYYDEPRYYAEPPVLYAPAPQPVFQMMPPDAVFASLDERGYRDLSPMAFRDGVYKLQAVNRRGQRVALELNVVTAEVMQEYVLAGDAGPVLSPRAYAPAPEAGAYAPAAPSRHGARGAHDPLVVY